MTRTVNIAGRFGVLTETPEQLIRACVDWLGSHALGSGSGTEASIGFILSQSVANVFGPGVAKPETELERPELIYTLGALNAVGHRLEGQGSSQSAHGHDTFVKSSDVFLRLEPPNSLSIFSRGNTGWNLIAKLPLTLHHDVLVGLEPTPIESTSPGSVVTVMLWGIPASPVR